MISLCSSCDLLVREGASVNQIALSQLLNQAPEGLKSRERRTQPVGLKRSMSGSLTPWH